MKPDQLIQCMRIMNRSTIRLRLAVIEEQDPEGYLVITNLFTPIVENRKRWSAKVAPAMQKIQEGIA